MHRPDGSAIVKWEDWTRPKRAYQWAEERSAMELAKAWFRGGKPAAPSELLALLDSEPRLKGLELREGVPELVTGLPMKGEGRNHDLWLRGETEKESVTICIEGKADEAFGNQIVAGYREAAIARRERGESTGVPALSGEVT